MTKGFDPNKSTPETKPVRVFKPAHYLGHECSWCDGPLATYVWETDCGVYCSEACADKDNETSASR